MYMSEKSRSRPGGKRPRGFTLVEVMVVVIIITLMGAIVAPTVFNQLRKAEEKRVEADLNAIESALKLYRLDNFAYPTEAQGLEALISEPSTARAWRGPYLDSTPRDPWETEYQYRNPSDHGLDFDIYSFGADGVAGGEGDDADLGNWELN
jgi:general secretion pathway protein G